MRRRRVPAPQPGDAGDDGIGRHVRAALAPGSAASLGVQEPCTQVLWYHIFSLAAMHEPVAKVELAAAQAFSHFSSVFRGVRVATGHGRSRRACRARPPKEALTGTERTPRVKVSQRR